MRLPARPRTTIALAAVVGLAHVALLFWVEAALGYPVGASHGTVPAVAVRAVGLVLLAAVPVGLALRYGLVSPLAVLVGATGFVVAAELAPPRPTFHQLGAFTVVDDGLFVARYARGWYVWLVAGGLAGLVEVVLRDRIGGPFRPWTTVPLRGLPVSTDRALRWTGAAGLAHALALTAYAHAVHVSGLTPLVVGWIAVGMAAVGAVPVYLALRHRLTLPLVALVGLLLLLVWAEFGASTDGPAPIFVVGWPVLLVGLLLVGAVEEGARRLNRRLSAAP